MLFAPRRRRRDHAPPPLHPRLPVRSPARPLLLATATMHSSSSSPSPPPPLPFAHAATTPEPAQRTANRHRLPQPHQALAHLRVRPGSRGLDWAHQPNPFLRFPDPSASASASPQTLPLIPPRPHDSPHYPLLFASPPPLPPLPSLPPLPLPPPLRLPLPLRLEDHGPLHMVPPRKP
uniref:Uncharacterized protein n=1 Tax=Ananas comosus var. bracteatus TaxID=296719 RepID=A0A6V7QUK7_ANACO